MPMRDMRLARQQKPISEINVTPMVDVMLVVLVIFMVTAPMLPPIEQSSLDVSLPDAQSSEVVSLGPSSIEVTISNSGEIQVGSQAVTLEDISAYIEEVSAGAPDPKLFLRADSNASYARVFEVMGVLNRAGFSDIGLVGEVSTNSDGVTN